MRIYLQTLLDWLYSKGLLHDKRGARICLLTAAPKKHGFTHYLFSLILLFLMGTWIWFIQPISSHSSSFALVFALMGVGLLFCLRVACLAQQGACVHRAEMLECLIPFCLIASKILIGLGCTTLYIPYLDAIPAYAIFLAFYLALSIPLTYYRRSHFDILISLLILLAAIIYFIKKDEFSTAFTTIGYSLFLLTTIILLNYQHRLYRNQWILQLSFSGLVGFFLLNGYMHSNDWQTVFHSQYYFTDLLASLCLFYSLGLFLWRNVQSFIPFLTFTLLLLCFGLLHPQYYLLLGLLLLCLYRFETALSVYIITLFSAVLVFHLYFLDLPNLFKFILMMTIGSGFMLAWQLTYRLEPIRKQHENIQKQSKTYT